MKIVIETIEHSKHRYPTVGDWWFDADGIQIRVSKMEDERYSFLVALHELVEAYLCKQNSVSEEAVTKWDLDHLYSHEPGDIPEAPYHNEHVKATEVENIIAMALSVDWDIYEKAVERLF